jgi:type III restriction enzyme
LLLERLQSTVPAAEAQQKDFFEPDMSAAKKSSIGFLTERARTLKRLLVHRSPLMPTGLLVFCLDYAKKDTDPLPGIFTAVRERFADFNHTKLRDLVDSAYNFRNEYIAHQKQELKDVETARNGIATWIATLQALNQAREHTQLSRVTGKR